MNKKLTYLIQKLLDEDKTQYTNITIPAMEQDQRKLLRALMNVRHPTPIDSAFLQIQDELLAEDVINRGVVDVATLPSCGLDSRIALWQGDILRLNADAIVNAANKQMLGCFHPNHACIDNVIHSAAGLQLRDECNQLMQQQNSLEPTGSAKITQAYNLPAKHVIHTVGPIIYAELTDQDCAALASCYNACIDIAEANNLQSIAFCCISTGEFRFPNQEAAEVAVKIVMQRINSLKSVTKIIFNVFKDIDYAIYNRLLNH